MDKMSKFGTEVRKILVNKIKSKKLEITIEKARHTTLTFEMVNDELRYFIETEILDKLSKADLSEIDSLWQSFKNK
jgi:hypothetical protein